MIKVVRFGKSKFHPEVEFTFANEKMKKNLEKLLTKYAKQLYNSKAGYGNGSW